MKKFRELSGKLVVAMLAVTLLIGCAIGGTVAWLTAKTDAVVNTFTYGDINIELTENKPTDKHAEIIPGVDIEKDPKVTVNANSETCWLFVKVKEENWPTFKETDGTTNKVSYAIANGWTALDGVAGVYYREVEASANNSSYGILADDKVTVSENLTKTEVNSIAAGTQPKLTFTAYAVQKDGIADAATAWAEVPTTTNP